MMSRLREAVLRVFAWIGMVDLGRLEQWRRSEQEAHHETERIRTSIERALLPDPPRRPREDRS